MQTNEEILKPEEKKLQEMLSKGFPDDAYTADKSRNKSGKGITLTSLKAQYIKERLNEVFTIFGWKIEGEYSPSQDGSVLYKGILTVRKGASMRAVSAVGFSPSKNLLGDAYKGSQTDCLSKCASFIGIGNDMFKGKVKPPYSPSVQVSTQTNTQVVNTQVVNTQPGQPMQTRKNMGVISDKQLKYLWIQVKNSAKDPSEVDKWINAEFGKAREELISPELQRVLEFVNG